MKSVLGDEVSGILVKPIRLEDTVVTDDSEVCIIKDYQDRTEESIKKMNRLCEAMGDCCSVVQIKTEQDFATFPVLWLEISISDTFAANFGLYPADDG